MASIDYLKTFFFQIGLQLPLQDLYLFGESVQRVLGVGGFEVAENFGLDNVWTFSAGLAKLRYPNLNNISLWKYIYNLGLPGVFINYVK